MSPRGARGHSTGVSVSAGAKARKTQNSLPSGTARTAHVAVSFCPTPTRRPFDALPTSSTTLSRSLLQHETPDDDCPVSLARQHQADHIVTGDKDLFEWDDQVLPAITPAAFEDLLSARSHP